MQQGEIRAVFLPLTLLQQELGLESRVNALLLSVLWDSAAASTTALEQLVRNEFQLEDLGPELRVLESRHAFALEAGGGLLSDAMAEAALAGGTRRRPAAPPCVHVPCQHFAQRQPGDPLFAGHRNGCSRTVESNLHNLERLGGAGPPGRGGRCCDDGIRRLGRARRLVTRRAEFRVSDVVPIDTRDRDLTPVYPGITESETLGDWDPPFPIDLRRIRNIDEQYWELHQTTPKAFIPFAVGERLWKSRYGSVTSIRFRLDPEQPLHESYRNYADRLRDRIDPLALNIAVRDVRAESLEASGGATDFGAYFVYFSLFLVVSALLLAALFFRLSIEQRAQRGRIAPGRGVYNPGRSLDLPAGRVVVVRSRVLPAGCWEASDMRT